MNDAQHRRRKKKHYLHREERPSLTRQVYVNNSCGRSYAAICCKSGLRSYTTITLLAPESLYLPSSSQTYPVHSMEVLQHSRPPDSMSTNDKRLKVVYALNSSSKSSFSICST